MTGIAIRADLTASPSAASIADMTTLTTEQRIDMAAQARAAAYRSLAEKLFGLIDAEISA